MGQNDSKSDRQEELKDTKTKIDLIQEEGSERGAEVNMMQERDKEEINLCPFWLFVPSATG